jgi:hypothetical protein
MGEVTIYLDDATERRVKAAARKSRVSVSQWIAELVQSRTGTDWPPEVRELAGAWPDFPDLRELRTVKGKNQVRGRL